MTSAFHVEHVLAKQHGGGDEHQNRWQDRDFRRYFLLNVFSLSSVVAFQESFLLAEGLPQLLCNGFQKRIWRVEDFDREGPFDLK
jgi:hypothetical protein